MNRLIRCVRSILWAAAILSAHPVLAQQTSYVRTTIIPNKTNVPCVEEHGQIQVTVQDQVYQKQYVLRYPEAGTQWNTRLVIGVHGESGGAVRYSRQGQVVGTHETALDDMIGEYALNTGYAYASVERIGGRQDGMAFISEFTRLMRDRLKGVHGRDTSHVYFVGWSTGGALTRYVAEESSPRCDGVIIVAGIAGDSSPQLDRQAKLATLWTEIDPRTHPTIPDTDPRVKAYAQAIGTPVGARPFWPLVGARQTLDNLKQTLERYGLTGLTEAQLKQFRVADYQNNATFRANLAKEQAKAQAENTTGKVVIPTIEVVGTSDAFVINDVLAYKEKVKKASASAKKPPQADLHRLYQVVGVWHLSSEDNDVPSFQYLMKQGGFSEEMQDQLTQGGSYIPIVQTSLDILDKWVTQKTPPPKDQTIVPPANISDK